MTSEFDNIDLRIPQLSNPSKDSFTTNPKDLNKWIKELPLANLGSTTQLLYKAIKEINSLNIKPNNRFELLEIFKPTVWYVIEGLRKHYQNKPLPLSEKNRDIAELSIDLFYSMSIGYKIIVEQNIKNIQKTNKKLFGQALQRSISFVSRTVVEGYLIYSTDREGVWGQLHQMYLLAISKKVQHTQIADSDLFSKKSITITDCYKQILLIATIDPYRMRLGEVVNIYNEMEHWAEKCQLATSIPGEHQAGVFLIRPSMDLPPVNFNSNLAERDANSFVFVTNELVKSIEKEISKNHKQGLFKRKTKEMPNEKLLGRVLLSLGVVPQRGFSRSGANTRVTALVGLNNIHQVMSLEQNIYDNLHENKSKFSSKDTIASSPRGKNDVWNLTLTGHEPFDGRHRTIHPSQTTNNYQHTKKIITPENWRLCNISAGGYCVLSDKNNAAKSQVGDLIAIRELNSENNIWQTGVIRWLKQIDDNHISFGVQILFPGGNPVITKVKGDDGQYLSSQKSILLPAIKAISQPSTIITTNLNYVVGKEVKIRAGKKSAGIVLTKLLQSTNNFCQFEYVATNKAENLPIGNNSEEIDFDTLWSSI